MRIPLSTYRLQFSSAFTFALARPVIAYLAALGITTVYASPVFQAKRGSTHGYDIINPRQLNSELGTAGDFEELTAQARAHGLSWLQDIVPNHMAYNGENEYLIDILENGEQSDYFSFFDIDWRYPYDTMKGRILAPFLGKFYGECLESGEITLQYGEEGLSIRYYGLHFPLRRESYVKVLSHELSSLKRELGDSDQDLIDFLGVLYSFKNLQQKADIQELRAYLLVAKNMLWRLYQKNPAIRSYLDRAVALLNGKPGNPESFNSLDRLLSEQLFRLSFWKVASEELNYRRFFTVNDLISLRVEDDAVFERTHALIIELVERGVVSGLRVDHIDGLFDPSRYLRKLRDRAKDAYIITEKILAFGEMLPSGWPVQGTTGYDYLNCVNLVFWDRTNEHSFNLIYRDFAGVTAFFSELSVEKKMLIIGKYMAGDVDNLARLIKNISSRDRQGTDITLYGLKRALVEILASFPVYRTYVNYETYSDTDRARINEALRKAKRANPLYMHELNFIEKFLTLRYYEYLNEDDKKQWIYFVMRFQQFTGPLMAKGVEDTLLYVYNRSIGLNEVGGSPEVFGIDPPEYHSIAARRGETYPHTLNATATHDTKRGEDTRARLAVISELPDEWAKCVFRWRKLNRKKKAAEQGKEYPAPNDEYFLYQSLIGHFPFYDTQFPAFMERLKTFMVKAVREAKEHTAWLAPDSEYEQAFLSFIDKIMAPKLDNRFLVDFLPFQKKISYFGMFNALSQTLLKITSPGVPDFYQGTEVWDLSFVDPDNRVPVDFAERSRALDGIIAKGTESLFLLVNELLRTKEDGRIKLFLIYRALQARNRHPAVFEKGEYLPVHASGTHGRHVVSFLRKSGNKLLLTVVPRFLTGLIREGEYPFGRRVWATTSLVIPAPAVSWRDVITGQEITPAAPLAVGDVLTRFPVALLEGTIE